MKQEDIRIATTDRVPQEHGVAEFDLERDDVKIRLKFAQPVAPRDLVFPGIRAGCRTFRRSAGRICARCRRCSRSRSGRRPVHHQVADGRNLLRFSLARRANVCLGRRPRGKGQVICIVEAMKLMNEIESDAAGEIVKVLVTNGQPVEFGQPLFSVRTA